MSSQPAFSFSGRSQLQMGLNGSLNTSNIDSSRVVPSHHLALLLVAFLPEIHQLY